MAKEQPVSDSPDGRPEWPQAVGEAISEVIGSTLDAIGRQALKDIYHATLGDHITAWRAGNLANVFRRYRKATHDLPPEGRRFVAEKLGIRLIEEASLEDNDELQKLWANLLAAAVSNGRPEVTTRYVSTAKELIPVEVLFLNEAYALVKGSDKPPLSISVTLKEGHAAWKTKADITDIVTHLISLGLIQRVEYAVKAGPAMKLSGGITHMTSIADINTVKFTKFGWHFICAAVEGATEPVRVNERASSA